LPFSLPPFPPFFLFFLLKQRSPFTLRPVLCFLYKEWAIVCRDEEGVRAPPPVPPTSFLRPWGFRGRAFCAVTPVFSFRPGLPFEQPDCSSSSPLLQESCPSAPFFNKRSFPECSFGCNLRLFLESLFGQRFFPYPPNRSQFSGGLFFC